MLSYKSTRTIMSICTPSQEITEVRPSTQLGNPESGGRGLDTDTLKQQAKTGLNTGDTVSQGWLALSQPALLTAPRRWGISMSIRRNAFTHIRR
jgi:hypothetical protein